MARSCRRTWNRASPSRRSELPLLPRCHACLALNRSNQRAFRPVGSDLLQNKPLNRSNQLNQQNNNIYAKPSQRCSSSQTLSIRVYLWGVVGTVGTVDPLQLKHFHAAAWLGASVGLGVWLGDYQSLSSTAADSFLVFLAPPTRASGVFLYPHARGPTAIDTIVTHPYARGLASPSSTAAAELEPTPIRHPRSSGRWAPSRNYVRKTEVQVSGLSLILFAYE